MTSTNYLPPSPEKSSFTPPETPSFSTLQDATARLVALTTSLPANFVVVIGIVAGLICGFASRPLHPWKAKRMQVSVVRVLR
ncbi:hypothetical protein BLNAU_16291 [Blattamonas nauphoetae]|uniref:Uncharacterized protein n=1 Tax=Blattamonas nauphoetae TaxID=2049346 RepID=A0ABQ9X8E4_9EUKA|nr:hypothetical protein BLNAU_16291 [Blattamonas nauphoetae]